MDNRRPQVPVSFFGIAVGMLALANAWRVADRLWQLPPDIASGLTLAGLATWLAVGAFYVRKWLQDADAAKAELQHPVQSAFVALVPVSSLLASMALIPYSHDLALAVFVLAVAAQGALGVWLQGGFWQGGRPPELITPAAYLPAVAQNFVAATAASAFGWHDLGLLFFGVGLFSWLAMESVIVHRAAAHDALPPALRPTLGVQLAPPVVGGVSWMSLNGGAPDLFALILLGYGVYQALLLIRLLPWITEHGQQAFSPAYWAFSFGVAALPTLAMRIAEAHASALVDRLAPVLFVASNVVFTLLIGKTLALLVRGRLLPAPAVPAVATAK
jgi:tellurite resistance protein